MPHPIIKPQWIGRATSILRSCAAVEPRYITWREIAETRRGTRCSPYDPRVSRWSYAGWLVNTLPFRNSTDVNGTVELIVRSLIVTDFTPIDPSFQRDSWAIEIGDNRPGIQRWHCQLMETTPQNRPYVAAEILFACDELDSRLPEAAIEYLLSRLAGVDAK